MASSYQLNTRSWPGIVNLTKEDLGLDKVPDFFHLGNKKLYPESGVRWILASAE